MLAAAAKVSSTALCAATIATSSSLLACMTPTPFGADVDNHALNASALRSLGAPRSPERIRFVALGDSHDAYDELWEATAAINRVADVDFVVHAGDVSDSGLAQ